MNLEVINVNIPKEHGEIPTHQDASDLDGRNVIKMKTVLVNWRVKIQFASIHAVRCPVAMWLFVFLNDMQPGADVKVDSKRTKLLENVFPNVKI